MAEMERCEEHFVGCDLCPWKNDCDDFLEMLDEKLEMSEMVGDLTQEEFKEWAIHVGVNF